MMNCTTDVTQILNTIEQGDPSASDKLLRLVYEELRVLARQRMANEKPGQKTTNRLLAGHNKERLQHENKILVSVHLPFDYQIDSYSPKSVGTAPVEIAICCNGGWHNDD
jgi:hypothetical protein